MELRPYLRSELGPLKELIEYLASHIRFLLPFAALLQVTESERLCQAVLHVCEQQGTSLALIKALVAREFRVNISNQSSILRGTCFASRMMRFYLKVVGEDYLHTLLSGPVAHLILDTDDSLEIDPVRCEVTALAPRRARLVEVVDAIFRHISSDAMIAAMPMAVRIIAYYVSKFSEQHAPKQRHSLIGGFLILRYINPFVLNPKLHRAHTDMLDFPRIHRNLTLVSKVLQNVANRLPFNEPFLKPLNAFVLEKARDVEVYLDKVCDISPEVVQQHEVFMCTPLLEERIDDRQYSIFRTFFVLHRNHLLTAVKSAHSEDGKASKKQLRRDLKMLDLLSNVLRHEKQVQERLFDITLYYSPIDIDGLLVSLFIMENNLPVMLTRIDVLRVDIDTSIEDQQDDLSSAASHRILLVDLAGDEPVHIRDCTAILQHLSSMFIVRTCWLPRTQPHCKENDRLLALIHSGLHCPLTTLYWRHTSMQTEPLHSSADRGATAPLLPEEVSVIQDGVTATLRELEGRLQSASGLVLDEHFTAPDFSLAVAVAYIRLFDCFDMATFPGILGLTARVINTCSYWTEVSLEFDGFVQYIAAERAGLPYNFSKMTYTVFFPLSPTATYNLILDPESVTEPESSNDDKRKRGMVIRSFMNRSSVRLNLQLTSSDGASRDGRDSREKLTASEETRRRQNSNSMSSHKAEGDTRAYESDSATARSAVSPLRKGSSSATDRKPFLESRSPSSPNPRRMMDRKRPIAIQTRSTPSLYDDNIASPPQQHKLSKSSADTALEGSLDSQANVTRSRSGSIADALSTTPSSATSSSATPSSTPTLTKRLLKNSNSDWQSGSPDAVRAAERKRPMFLRSDTVSASNLHSNSESPMMSRISRERGKTESIARPVKRVGLAAPVDGTKGSNFPESPQKDRISPANRTPVRRGVSEYFCSREVGGEFSVYDRRGINLVLAPAQKIVQTSLPPHSAALLDGSLGDSLTPGHNAGTLTTETFELSEGDERFGEGCEVAFTQINIPPTLLKEQEEWWAKFWRRIGGIATTRVDALVFFIGQLPHELFDMLSSPQQLARVSRTKCKQEFDGTMCLFNRQVVAHEIESQPGRLLVQRWWCHDWPERHHALMTMRLSEVEGGTRAHFLITNVPIDRERSLKRLLKSVLFSKLGGVVCDDLSQTVVVSRPLSETYQVFVDPVLNARVLKTKCSNIGELNGEFSMCGGAVTGCTLLLWTDLKVSFTFHHKDWPITFSSLVHLQFASLSDTFPETQAGNNVISQDGSPGKRQLTQVSLRHLNVPSKQHRAIVKWWGDFWGRLGGIITDDLQSCVHLPSVQAPVAMQLVTNNAFMAEITKGKCSIVREEGAPFSMYSGYVSGTVVSITPLSLKLLWRAADWPEEHSSLVEISAEGSMGACTLTLSHRFIPAFRLAATTTQWDSLWKKMKLKLTASGPPACPV